MVVAVVVVFGVLVTKGFKLWFVLYFIIIKLLYNSENGILDFILAADFYF